MQQGGGGGGDGEGGGGGGGTQSQYGEMATTSTATAAAAAAHIDMGQQPVEAASPISSRPPASASNLDELMRLSGGDDDEGDRGGGVSSGNRWPSQETLALLKIRSDMDAAFRDATVKGPLWEDVSRKLAELGYKRSAKKCKEKFENVHKYYKRTKEGRAGRQDGKSYKFFTQLEALHSSPTSTSTSTATTSNVSASLPKPMTTVADTSTLDVAPVSVGIPMPISSSVRIPTSPITLTCFPYHDLRSTLIPAPSSAVNVPGSVTTPVPPTATTSTTPVGISFSSKSSSSSPETEDDDDDVMDFEGQPSNTAGTSNRKRKRQTSSSHRMMAFFEGLMKQVMQKQEAMQQSFLEVIEKRERDRMIREEAWKRQEMSRLAREHELMAQERAISASRDASIINFLQKITGQTIQLPPAITIPAAPPPPPPQPQSPSQAVPVATNTTQSHHMPPPERRDIQQHHHRHQQIQSSAAEAVTARHQQPSGTVSTSIPSQVVMAVPEQQVPPSDHQEIGSGGNLEPASSRWPKVEVLALIKLRSGLEHRYQEAGPKGPLWEEISVGMQRMGYNRNAKRCKEKWENINKYFKKVKESNKRRPEDAKTCPYFHELDALYRKKIIGVGGTSTSSQNRPEERHQSQSEQQHQQENVNPVTNPQESSINVLPAPLLITQAHSDSENKNGNAQASNVGVTGSLFGEGNLGASKKPEDIVKELMNQQGTQQKQQQPQASIVDDQFDKVEESNMGSESDNMEYEEDERDDDEESEEDSNKMANYKVEFQRQNTSNGGGNGAPSFLAMVQ